MASTAAIARGMLKDMIVVFENCGFNSLIEHSYICVIFYDSSSFMKDDITYRALPDLQDMVSHPTPTRLMRSTTPPPYLSSFSPSGKTLGTYLWACETHVTL